MADMYDITVRMPVHMETPEFTAGFVERAVANAMEDAGYIGTPFVIWRNETTGLLNSFVDGEGINPNYQGAPPHG